MPVPPIARMDGDDIALPTRLEKQFQFLESEIALVGCACIPIDEYGNPIPGLGISLRPTTQEAIAKTMLLASPCSHVWLARSELLGKLSGYREISVSEDFDFLLRAVTAGFLLGNLQEPLMRIRTRPGQNSGSLQQRRAHDYVVRLYRERLKYGVDTFSLENYKHAIKTSALEGSAFRVAQRCNQKGIQSRSKFLRFTLACFSATLSPWQVRYFIDRIRLKRAWRMAIRPS